MCGTRTGTKTVQNSFVELELEVLHKSKELPKHWGVLVGTLLITVVLDVEQE
jgi:hypothetical protein